MKKIEAFDLLHCPLRGTNLIEASAGTGKTYTITGLFLRLLLENRLRVNEILVVTYTVAATEELRDRIREKIKELLRAFSSQGTGDRFLIDLVKKNSHNREAIFLLNEALRDFDESAIFTIHSFCQRMLQDKAFESGSLFNTELIADQNELLREIADDFWRKQILQAPYELILFARGKKINPDSLVALTKHNLFQENLQVLPIIESSALDSLKSYNIIRLKINELWPAIGKDIQRILNDPGLDQSQSQSIKKFVEEMDNYLSSKGKLGPPLNNLSQIDLSNLRYFKNKNDEMSFQSFLILYEDLFEKYQTMASELNHYLLTLKQDFITYLRNELPPRKQRLNVQSYDDLLIRLQQSLHQTGRLELARQIRGQYKAALIDEFQDTDAVQYDIFRSIFESPDSLLFLIGDPKQAIYSFRGADLFAYMKAVNKVKTRYTLTGNWRSEPGLIKAVNAFFSSSSNPFLYEEIPFIPAKPEKEMGNKVLTFNGKTEAPFHLWFLTSDQKKGSYKPVGKMKARDQISQSVAAEISRLLEMGRKGKVRIGENPLREEDIAVLVRSNREARLIERALRNLAIPCVLYSRENIFDSNESLEIERFLRALAEPNQESLLKAALASDMIGKTGEELDHLMGDESNWEGWLSAFRSYADLWGKRGFIHMFRTFLENEKVRSRLLSFPDGERRLTNVLHLGEVLHQKSIEEKLGGKGLIKWLIRQRDPKTRGHDREEDLLRLESDAHAVQIATLHKCKGLEYPIVFCPFNWGESLHKKNKEFVFHDKNQDWQLNLVLDPEDHPATEEVEKENLAENLRLLYVALTRARNRCYLVWGRINKAETSSLAYLLHYRHQEESNLVQKTGEYCKKITDQEWMDDLNSLIKKSDGTIRLQAMPRPKQGELLPFRAETRDVLNCRVFSGSIKKDWQITSFSSLIPRKDEWEALNRQGGIDLPDYDQGAIVEEVPWEDPTEGIFSFPKGAKAGNFLHDIFEQADFDDLNDLSTNNLIEKKLKEHGFDLKWQEVIYETVTKVLQVPLPVKGDPFTLSLLGKKDRLPELEFTFPLRSITPNDLSRIFKKYGESVISSDFPTRIDEMQFYPAQGFMRGFIDLVFNHKQRFFIIDWKSNYLGNRLEDYHTQNLKTAMEKNYYILQYYFYAVALDRYLQKRLPDYDYEKHFGGVFYFFVRGVDPARGSEFGIYHDLPRQELMNALSKALIG